MDQPLPKFRGPKEDWFSSPPLYNDEVIFLRVVHKHELFMMSGGTHVLLSFCQTLSWMDPEEARRGSLGKMETHG